MPNAISNSIPDTASRTEPHRHWPLLHALILLGLWIFLFAAALFTPPLLDDADSTHAQAAQAMLSTNDWVTLHVDGIRYLEKPPLPYWIAALSLRLFAPPATAGSATNHTAAFTAFAIHLPLALTILGLALLGYAWSRRAFGSTAALYTALFVLTSAGVFLFTRVFIPDALLSLLLAFSLYALLRSLEPDHSSPPVISTETKQSPTVISTETKQSPTVISTEAQRSGEIPAFRSGTIPRRAYPYLLWTALALAVLTKGLVTLVFFFGTAILFLAITGQLSRWRELHPLTGSLLFLSIAAPWHILAGLRNTGGANGHGFFWFYFINEHVLRFLGRRIPRDYNKLPAYLYWSLHLVWLFPWSLFAPAAVVYAWRSRKSLRSQPTSLVAQGSSPWTHAQPSDDPFPRQTVLILLIFSALVLVFFSLSTNQEYYTFPVYLPLLMLLAAALTAIERNPLDPTLRRALSFAFAALTLIGLAVAAALAYGLIASRHLPFVPDIGELLAHRDVGGYTLSMSHFFDLTGPSFAALRLPATLALLAFLFGPPLAWFLHTRRRFLPAILTVALTSTVFLFAAHIALVRFSPMLSSANFACTIQTLETNHAIDPDTQILLYGDQAFGSSIPFYLAQTSGHPNRHVLLVDGRSTSMLFGSTFPDAPPIFLTPAQLLAEWGTGPRKLLFVPLEQRDTVDHLLGPRQIILQQTSGKALITDRPL
jgi:4-amino-4-deoxy-L-arabinose transferase-like glycosyltransferase